MSEATGGSATRAARARARLVAAAHRRVERHAQELEAQSTESDVLARDPENLEILPYASPVDFARQVIGIEPWTRQAELLEAVATNKRTAVRSGHKIAKSNSAALLALWWVKCKPQGRVIMTATTDLQVRGIFWKEVRDLYRRSQRKLGGKINISPRTGLKYPDGREILGFTARDTEGMGGFSGANMLILVDEASGVDEEIMEAIMGNRAGGATVVLFGNPTRTSGTFYNAFTSARDSWKTIHISSEEAAAYQRDVRVIPGLATQEWVDECLKEWGENSPLFQVRVRGNFASQAENAVIGLTLVEDAAKRWAETPADGRLEVGVDVARFGDDETVIFGRRGMKPLPPMIVHSMDGPDVAGKVREYIAIFSQRNASSTWFDAALKSISGPDVIGQMRAFLDRTKPQVVAAQTIERPRVKVDVIGVGASVYDALVRMPELEAVAINVASAPTAKLEENDPGFVKLRDQLWFALRDYLRGGGTLPPDPKLEAELVGPTYGFDNQGKRKVMSKDDMKKTLKRSPDRADALALAVYNPPPPPVAETIPFNMRRR